MKTPRDRNIHHRTGRVRTARLYSNIVSPPNMFAVLGLAFAWRELPFWPGFLWAAVYGLPVSLAPILVVLFLLKTGRISELQMSHTRERHIPYATAVFFAALAYVILTIFDGPELLRCLALFNTIELAALGIINIWWLISIHATGIMATMILVGLVFGWTAALLWVLPFVISVSWVRLYLQRHTPVQVGAGLLLGILTVFSLILMGCFS